MASLRRFTLTDEIQSSYCAVVGSAPGRDDRQNDRQEKPHQRYTQIRE